MMRRTLLWFITAAAVLMLPCVAVAATPIDATTFPDANFRAIALADYSDGSGNVDTSVTFINVTNKSIADLTGIEHFTNLTQLYCVKNSLTELDVSANTQLKLLACGTNALTALDLSHNPSLNTLSCTDNSILALDLSATPNLITFLCGGNRLSSLDLSAQTTLATTSLNSQTPPSLAYSQSGGTYQVDLTELPYGHLIDMTRVEITNGGILDTSTGIVTYTSLPATVAYTYDTLNAHGGLRFMVVTIEVTEPLPQTGDGAHPGWWSVLALLAAAGIAAMRFRPGRINER